MPAYFGCIGLGLGVLVQGGTEQANETDTDPIVGEKRTTTQADFCSPPGYSRMDEL